ncbi:MAG: hypothetical protein ACFB10_00030 [Salibacteraceae bacterium]
MITKDTYAQAIAFLIKVIHIDDSNVKKVIEAAKIAQAYKEQEYNTTG